MSLYLKDRHLALLGIALLAVIAARLILADTGTTPLNPGHPLSQTWIDTNLNLGAYNLYTLGNVGIGTAGPGAETHGCRHDRVHFRRVQVPGRDNADERGERRNQQRNFGIKIQWSRLLGTAE